MLCHTPHCDKQCTAIPTPLVTTTTVALMLPVELDELRAPTSGFETLLKARVLPGVDLEGHGGHTTDPSAEQALKRLTYILVSADTSNEGSAQRFSASFFGRATFHRFLGHVDRYKETGIFGPVGAQLSDDRPKVSSVTCH